MADPTAVQMERFEILFIPLSANFFVDICLCYHKSNDTYYVRIKMMEFVPYCFRPYASQLDYYTPGSMQLDGGDLTKIHTYLCEDMYKRNMSVAPLLISAVASGHLKLNKFYFVFLSDWYNTFELSSDIRILGYLITSEAEGRASSIENKGKSWVLATGRPWSRFWEAYISGTESPIDKRSSLVGTPIPSTVYGTNAESCQYPLWHVARATWGCHKCSTCCFSVTAGPIVLKFGMQLGTH